MSKLPLDGIRVLDFSTLLPGPLATLFLTEAGAEVVKVEPPGRGDEMRHYEPKLGSDGANFAFLNRGKSSIVVDLKTPWARDLVLDLAAGVDILVEQFRPGVMDRLGLGYSAVCLVNPDIIYCSITGFGQTEPDSGRAGHDLNYLAETGLLSTVIDSKGQPPIPPVLIADIAAGTYPAVLNILLALRRRDQQGKGLHLDIGMAPNLQPLAYANYATYQSTGRWPKPGRGLVTGGSPRYYIYRTADQRYLAAAPLEDKFWDRFAELIELPERFRNDEGQEQVVISAVAERIVAQPAQHWRSLFEDEDVCCAIVATLPESLEAGFFSADSAHRLVGEGFNVPALPLPLAPELRIPPLARGYPALGDALEENQDVGSSEQRSDS